MTKDILDLKIGTKKQEQIEMKSCQHFDLKFRDILKYNYIKKQKNVNS